LAALPSEIGRLTKLIRLDLARGVSWRVCCRGSVDWGSLPGLVCRGVGCLRERLRRWNGWCRRVVRSMC